jgi:hypothetical protein
VADSRDLPTTNDNRPTTSEVLDSVIKARNHGQEISLLAFPFQAREALAFPPAPSERASPMAESFLAHAATISNQATGVGNSVDYIPTARGMHSPGCTFRQVWLSILHSDFGNPQSAIRFLLPPSSGKLLL